MFRKKLFVFLCLFTILFSLNAINIKAAGWGFSKNPNHETPEIGKYKKMIEDTSTYYVGDETQKVVYLTFDAGYDNGQLEKILKVLKDKNVKASFFITGDLETKIKRIEEVRGFNREDAVEAIKRHDKNRKAYHNYYSDMKWGDSRNYDMCINSSRIGLDKTTDVIENYIRSRVEV